MTPAARIACAGLGIIAVFSMSPAQSLDGGINLAPAAGTIEYGFTPGDDVAGMIIRAIDAARSQVLVQAFSFTHEDIAAALVRAERRGLDVQVIADPGQIELIEHNVIPRLAAAGVKVFTDAEHGSAHDKVMLIDPESTTPAMLTGSFNFTYAAQFRNAENLLLIRGNPALAGAYLANWRRHRSHAVAFAMRQ